MIDKLGVYIKSSASYAADFFRWLFLGVTVGVFGGLVGTLFSKSISFVTELRSTCWWLIFLLPLGGLATVGLYKLCRVSGANTNHVIENVRGEKEISPLLTPAIFLASILTHLFGGSAGREGAALQLGGGLSALLAKLLRLDKKTTRVLTMSAMGAVFSALFSTPLGACVFAVEVVGTGQLVFASIFPCVIAGFTAYAVAAFSGVEPERFLISNIPDVTFGTLWKVLLIAAAGALVSFLFCKALHYTEKLFKKIFKNDFLRIFIGGAAVVLLTVLLKTTDYNGGGMEVINRIFTTGDVKYEAFLLKIIFTVITVSAGYKGGEIVPSLFIGATLGGSIATMLGISPSFGAAIGMAALFCGVTNCTLSTIIICIELFGAECIMYFAIAAVLSRILSGGASLYVNQASPLLSVEHKSTNDISKTQRVPQ